VIGTPYPPGTAILRGSARPGHIVEFERRYGQDGYRIEHTVGPPSHSSPGTTFWVPADTVRRAVVGENVCATPWPHCRCGMAHARDLSRVPRAGDATAEQPPVRAEVS
jgi:hypothetical protein